LLTSVAIPAAIAMMLRTNYMFRLLLRWRISVAKQNRCCDREVKEKK
jgi:hypothetical protein